MSPQLRVPSHRTAGDSSWWSKGGHPSRSTLLETSGCHLASDRTGEGAPEGRPCPGGSEEPEAQHRGREGAAQQRAGGRPQGRAEGAPWAQRAWLRLYSHLRGPDGKISTGCSECQRAQGSSQTPSTSGSPGSAGRRGPSGRMSNRTSSGFRTSRRPDRRSQMSLRVPVCAERWGPLTPRVK